MTVAEKMAKEWARIIQPVDSAKQAEQYVEHLITTIAERGREKAVMSLGRCNSNKEYPTYIQGDEAEFHILDNKWEEEEA